MVWRFAWALWMAACSAVAVGQSTNNEQSYRGPNFIGVFRIDKEVQVKQALARLGPASPATTVFCYRSSDGGAFLWFSRRAHHPNQVGNMLLSAFPNCHDCPVHTTSETITTWETEKGIRLGSTANDVLRAYGKPSVQRPIAGTAYRWLIQGDYVAAENRYRPRERPELGDMVLAYGGTDDLRSAAFGIRSDRVVWISLSNSE
jgi:hypothetical protein